MLARTGGFLALALIMALSHSSPAQNGWIEDFESGGPDFGFERLDRGGDLGLSAGLRAEEGDPALQGTSSVFLGESWDAVSRDLGIEEGIVSLWFYDTGYTGPNANAIRLRTAGDSESFAGWPLDFLTVEAKGSRTGHGGGDIDYYYVNRPAPGRNAMNIFFGSDIETGEYVKRRMNAWNHVSFVLDGGAAHASVNHHFTDCILESPPARLELLCRSGWYFTRGGDPKIMLWDSVSVMPKIASTAFGSLPHWIESAGAADLVFSASPESDFVFLPGAETAARITGPDTVLTADWPAERGEIELWFWDPYHTEPGYKTEIGVRNKANPDEYIVVKAYSVVMNAVSGEYYASTHQSGHGGSFRVPRTAGWHKVSIRKTDEILQMAIDGYLAEGAGLTWNQPPDSLELFIRSGSENYHLGAGLWLGRLTMAGAGATGVFDWSLR